MACVAAPNGDGRSAVVSLAERNGAKAWGCHVACDTWIVPRQFNARDRSPLRNAIVTQNRLAPDLYLTARFTTVRQNDSNAATFRHHDLLNPFAEGSYRWVAKGMYASGFRGHEPCVIKWFKRDVLETHDASSYLTSTYYDEEIYRKVIEKAIDLVSEWNHLQRIDRLVMVNRPHIWTWDE